MLRTSLFARYSGIIVPEIDPKSFGAFEKRSPGLDRLPGGGGSPYSRLFGEAAPGRGAFLKLAVVKGRENCHFSSQQGHKISCKLEEMVAKVKYIKGCHILAEMITDLRQNERLTTGEKRGDYRKLCCFGFTLS